MAERELTTFGVYCKRKISELGIEDKDIAKHIGVSQQYLSDVFYGRKRGLKYLEAIIDYIKESELEKTKKDERFLEAI